MPGWVKTLLDEWLQAANLTAGKLFRRVNKNGKAWGDGLTEKAVWHVVREHAHGADTVPSRARLDPNHGALSGLQAAHSRRRQRSHRHRTEKLNREHRVRVADQQDTIKRRYAVLSALLQLEAGRLKRWYTVNFRLEMGV